uniref:Amino acid adenylation domain-containing protein n=1 Tax=Candidatus Kentrum sp. FW TaxID=2126338 RepID=A0A450RTB9_9GAMM|nr:MAG: amino acid adenylation domain-containing protein [Candidatus Kentron sp. FW]
MANEHYPLSSSQLDFWFDQILHPDVPLYNIGGHVRIDGPIDPTLFEQALGSVIAQNDALRIILHEGDDLPTQTFAEDVPWKLDFRDLSGEADPHGAAPAWMQQKFARPFPLYEKPLFRFALCKVAEDCWYWLMQYHHIIVDGWGISLIVQRATSAYNALAEGRALDAIFPSYRTFIDNDRVYLGSERFARDLAYWRDKYRELPEPLFTPRHAAEFQGQIIPSQRATLRLERSFYDRLATFAKAHRASTFHVILGAFYCYFVRAYQREEFSIGLFTLNRNTAALKRTAGMFTTASPAWFRFGTELNFAELIQRVGKTLQKDYRHQRFPIGELHRRTGPDSQHIFDLTLSYAGHDYDAHLNDSPTRTVYLHHGYGQGALAIFVEEFHRQDDVNIYFDHNLGFFDAHEIERLKARFEFLLHEVLRRPTAPIRELQIIPDSELHRITVEWNNTRLDYPHDNTTVDLFEKQAAETPEAIAVVLEDRQLTYGELNGRANRLTHRLRSLSIESGEAAGLCTDASMEMIVGLLGILKAGGAYVPIDPDYPRNRLAFMLSDARIKVLLTQQKQLEKLPQPLPPVFCLDGDWDDITRWGPENPARSAGPEDPAYIIYTSGSTGEPKGACIHHRGFTNLVSWFVTDFGLTAADRVLVISSFGFDLTQKNFFAPLIIGGQLHLSPTHYDPGRIMEIVGNRQITWLNCTPSAFYPLLESNRNNAFRDLASLRYVFLGGEPISPAKLQPWLRSENCRTTIVNTYGPTECTDVCASYSLTPSDVLSAREIPIGKPIFNTQLFILGKHLDVLPTDTIGELHIGGAGVGQGYLNRPELTAEKFIRNPFSGEPGARLYKTGDLCRWLPDGTIEYLGRMDNQVKLRGFRIELGEIETLLNRYPLVKEAVVIFDEVVVHDKRLIAYIVSDTEESTKNLDDLIEGTKTSTLSQWQDLFEDGYSQLTQHREQDFDLTGWNSSYTGFPIPVEEMREWVNFTVDAIMSLEPDSVLEIGCGTGLLLSRIAPHCQRYWGTDFSLAVIQQVEQLKSTVVAGQLENVMLFHQKADDFHNIPEETFDTIILNSVVQYFPDVAYLLTVLEKAIETVKPGGVIFVGDIRNLPLLEACHASVQLHKASDSFNRTELRRHVRQSLRHEEELAIDPAFFLALRAHNPRIKGVRIQPKRGHYHNELTRFRYQVILHIGNTEFECLEETNGIQWIDWPTQLLALSDLRQKLIETQPEQIGVQNVSNARLETENETLQWLRSTDDAGAPQTVGQFRTLLSKRRSTGIDPESLWKLSDELPYEIEISWTNADTEGRYDVLFRHRTRSGSKRPVLFPVTDNTDIPKPWHHYANNPLQDRLDQQLTDQLRRFTASHLPDYMVPSRFILLESFPLTPNGKVDRRALSERPIKDLQQPDFVAPRTVEEKLLADIWAEVLGIRQIGIHDDFFQLGGHSLLATQVVSRIRDRFHIEMPLLALFEHPTVAGLNERIRTTRIESDLPPITPIDRAGQLPLSFAQQRLWFLDRLEGESPTYNVVAAARLDGNLDGEALERSFQMLVARHESLRTVFPTVDGAPSVRITDDPWEMAVSDLRTLPPAEQEPAVERLLKEEALHIFDLATGPLFRARLIRLGDTAHILQFNLHHIITDAWSLGIFVREWRVAYASACFDSAQQPSNQFPERSRGGRSRGALPPLPIQYVDFANWQRQWLTGEVLDEQVAYWKEQLAGVPGLLELPTDHPRPPVQSYRGASLSFSLPADLTDQLKQLGQQTGATLFMTLWSAFAVLLSRYSGQDDIIIGSPIAGRAHGETESIMGLFVNTLALRLDLAGDPAFAALLEQARDVSLQAHAHQDIPFEHLVDVLQPVRNLSHAPIFQVMFVLQNAPLPDLELSGLSLSLLDTESVTAKFDLTLEFREIDGVLTGRLEYATDLFERATMARLVGHLEMILAGIVAAPETPIHELPLLTEAEQQQFLAWNDTAVEYPLEKTIVDLFEEQVEKSPDAVAVVFPSTGSGQGEDRPFDSARGEQLTYRELNAEANRLGHYLRKLGVGPEVLVGICVERSLEMVIGLLGILKAGGAYVPLDPDYPMERLAFMLEDADVTVLLSQSNLAGQLPKTKARLICLDTDAEVFSGSNSGNVVSGVGAENSAYVIYTSGSTGRPKGVMVEHGNLYHSNFAREKYYGSTELGAFLLLSSIGFDSSVAGIFWSLTQGATLVLPEKQFDVDVITNLIVKCHISHLLCVPSVYSVLLSELKRFRQTNLKVAVVAGESSSENLLIEHYATLPNAKLFNEYGPTEGTVWSSVYCFESSEDKLDCIGTPITNTELHILDGYLQPLPIGIPGELHIGGAGVARGYLNRPELTAEKFISNPFSDDPASRLYKTGDLARWLPDGNIEYLGRMDNQVKLRGFRIELGEIEAQLTGHPDVQEAVVVARENKSIQDEPGEKRLMAFIASDLVPTRIPYESSCLVEQDGPSIPLQTVDICTAGILLEGTGTLDKGQDVRVHVQLPGEIDTRRLLGRVAYSRDGTTGIDFKLTPEEQILMDQGVIHELEDKGFIGFLQYSLRDKLRLFLQEKLPDYMIPSEFVLLISLPLTPNGKVDRRALSQHSIKALQRPDKGFVAPRTPEEKQLAEIWAEVLGIERVSIRDNFFDLGGHSLLAVTLLSKVEKQFGRDLPLSALFQGPTVAELATRLVATTEDTVGKSTDPWRPLVAIQTGGVWPPFFCLPGAGGNVLYFQRLAHALGEERPFYGLQAVGLDGESEPDTTVEAMAARYIREIRTVQPQGPYLLGGHSFGGWVGLEMSKQLQEQEEQVARLAIFDTTVPSGQPIGADWEEADWIIEVAHIAEHLLGITLEISDSELRRMDTDEQLAHLHGLLGQNGWELSVKQLQALVRIFRANCQMDYVPRDISPIPISLFKAREPASVTRTGIQMEAFSQPLKADPTWGWGQYAAGTVELHEVPGNHYTMMNGSNAQVLAERLRGCLDIDGNRGRNSGFAGPLYSLPMDKMRIEQGQDNHSARPRLQLGDL